MSGVRKLAKGGTMEEDLELCNCDCLCSNNKKIKGIICIGAGIVVATIGIISIISNVNKCQK